MIPLTRLERQYVAYYLFNIMRAEGEPQFTMEAPTIEPRMRELRLLTATIAELQGDRESADDIRRLRRMDDRE
jgi:hypothetical protein